MSLHLWRGVSDIVIQPLHSRNENEVCVHRVQVCPEYYLVEMPILVQNGGHSSATNSHGYTS